jgi:hypothetical protein
VRQQGKLKPHGVRGQTVGRRSSRYLATMSGVIAARLYLPSAAISDFAFCCSAVAVEGFFVTESSARIARARREAASTRRSPAG